MADSHFGSRYLKPQGGFAGIRGLGSRGQVLGLRILTHGGWKLCTLRIPNVLQQLLRQAETDHEDVEFGLQGLECSLAGS